MSVGMRQLSVLREFKPFGLTVEESDGESPEGAAAAALPEYEYILFAPETTRERSSDPLAGGFEFSGDDSAPCSSDLEDHELFIRGNRIIWSTGSRVYKRYTTPSAVSMVCWSRMDSISETVLCVLQANNLSIYSAQGEEISVPLTYSVSSIWPLPTGLLLQKSSKSGRAMSALSPVRDVSCLNKEHGLSSFEPVRKDNNAPVSSHLVLTHPLEEPQAIYFEERGKLNVMKDVEEKTIFTSDSIPLMVSFNKGKLQHSIWQIEIIPHSETNFVGPTLLDSSDILSQKFAFRRIWQGKCSQSPASKVFLATDIDATPVICLLLSDQKILLGIGLQIEDPNFEGLIDIKPDSSWTLPAIDAAPVIVTRPRIRAGPLPFADIIALSSENILFLYSGKLCLCKYSLPIDLVKGFGSHGIKITNVGDSVEGRINITCNNNQIFRCLLRKYPSSSLVGDCITALAEGLHSPYYTHFSSLLWGNSINSYLSDSNSHPDQEWLSFTSVISQICIRIGVNLPKRPSPAPNATTAWDLLKCSRFHAQYCKQYCISIRADAGPVASPVASEWSYSYNNQDKIGKDVPYYTSLIRETLDSLHALYESLKLNILRKQDVERLASLLYQIAECLGEGNYTDYYIRDFHQITTGSPIPRENYDIILSDPPSIFLWLETALQKGIKSVDSRDIPALICGAKSSVLGWARKILSFYSLILGAERGEEQRLSTGVYCGIAGGSSRNEEEITVLSMVAERFSRRDLDLLPVGVSLPLRHVLDKCRECPPSDWPASAYVLVGREDLAMARLGSIKGEDRSQSGIDLVSLSVPYMLHLKPVTVPPSLPADPMRQQDGLNSDDADSLYRSVEDGMEHIFNSSTQLRFGRDLRLNEVRRLLCSARPVAIPMTVNPTASDQDVQQQKLWNLAQRTTALPFGRGAFTLATTYTLLTEALVIPKLNLAGRLPAHQNAMVNLDPNIRSISELRSWPEFHNGVAAGLRLAPSQGKMSRTWIQYNRPEEPNSSHAGFLLALGLHQHLLVLPSTDVYRYLSQEHDITAVGILLGLAASNRGTMNPTISKILSLHIPSMYPSTFPELELPTLLQSAALMSIGLLYEGSAHPITMKILLREIGRRSGGDNVLEREGYSVAAGSALGLVALGRGGDAFGFIDSFVDRLFQYIGTKGFQNDKCSNTAVLADEQTRNLGQVMDGPQLNVDVTAPGATIALALIFLKTESEAVASRIYIPMTHFDLQYVRPDFIMLRIIARNLIMWSRIQPRRDVIESQVPEFIKIGISKIGEGAIDSDFYDTEALFQAYVNIVTGTCISLGLKYAGTKNGDCQELLYNYAIYFLNEIKHVQGSSKLRLPKGLLQYVDRGTLELCLHLIVLSVSLVMAGSGHLQTFRLLRYLRSRSSAEGHINYGLQMAVSMAIGFLFLGAGMQTFSTENSAIASLLITLYPRLPTGPNDNRCHLQAFRHLYVLATESRWIQTVDVDTGLPVYCPLEITVKETEVYSETTFCEVTPCILPERSMLKSVRVCGPRYWTQFIQLEPKDKPWWRTGEKSDPFNGGLLYIKRKVGSCSYSDDPVGSQSLLSRAMHKVCGTTGENSFSGTTGENSFKVDQLVTTFSADPSLISFAKICCDSSQIHRSDPYFTEFCSQVLYECVSKDRPALLQVYLSLYTVTESILEQAKNGFFVVQDSLFLSSLKVALAYNDALVSGRLSQINGGGIIQPTFIESLSKRIEKIFTVSQRLKDNFLIYLGKGKWPKSQNNNNNNKMDPILLSWYLIWYSIPPPHVVNSALNRISNEKINAGFSVVLLLRLLFPTTHPKGITEIDNFRVISGK